MQNNIHKFKFTVIHATGIKQDQYNLSHIIARGQIAFLHE